VSTKYLSAEEFKKLAKEGGTIGADVALCAPMVLDEIKAVEGQPSTAEGGAKQFEFTISTAAVDRYGDTIAVEGWSLDNYRKNPVVLWAHDSHSPPIARSPQVWADAGKLKAVADFGPTHDIDPFANLIRQLIDRRVVNACSVGFHPKKHAFNEGRGSWAVDYLEQDLLEWSPCPVPANPEALIGVKAAGIDLAPMREWVVKFLDGELGPGLWVPKDLLSREQAERAWEIARGGKQVSIAMFAPAAKATESTRESAGSTVAHNHEPAGATPAPATNDPSKDVVLVLAPEPPAPTVTLSQADIEAIRDDIRREIHSNVILPLTGRID
jgi:HK97 family phage prohead protease